MSNPRLPHAILAVVQAAEAVVDSQGVRKRMASIKLLVQTVRAYQHEKGKTS